MAGLMASRRQPFGCEASLYHTHLVAGHAYRSGATSPVQVAGEGLAAPYAAVVSVAVAVLPPRMAAA